MAKRLAVIVRERQDEALRMAVGLTLKDDSVDVFVLDRKVEENDGNRLNLDTMEMMEVTVYTNVEGVEGQEYIETAKLARKLLDYDIVLPY